LYNLQNEINRAINKLKEESVNYMFQLSQQDFDTEMEAMHNYFKNDEAILIQELKDYQDYIKLNGLETDYNNYIRSK